MSIEFFIIGILVTLLIGQQAFWFKMTLNLTNRLMSRNYAELLQAEQSVKTRPAPVIQQESIDPNDERQAAELNSLFGIA